MQNQENSSFSISCDSLIKVVDVLVHYSYLQPCHQKLRVMHVAKNTFTAKVRLLDEDSIAQDANRSHNSISSASLFFQAQFYSFENRKQE